MVCGLYGGTISPIEIIDMQCHVLWLLIVLCSCENEYLCVCEGGGEEGEVWDWHLKAN